MRKLIRLGGVLVVFLFALVAFRLVGSDIQARLFPPSCVKVAAPGAPDDGSTRLDIWFGPTQTFGQLGQPSLYVNVLGNVADNDGIDRLSYRLNGRDPITVPIGQDCRRLAEPGDFNIDLLVADLREGSNELEVIALDGAGDSVSSVVELTQESGTRWPLPYSIDWSEVSTVPDVALPVDGNWAAGPDGVRTLQLGYDRVLNVGDLSWTDYEATMSMTLHSIDEAAGFGWPSNGPAVGFIVRWIGHFPVDEVRPADGFTPLGSLAWYRWIGDTLGGRLVLSNTDGTVAVDKTDEAFPVGSTQWLKVRVETIDGGYRYAVKMWPEGESEPEKWDLVNNQPEDAVDSGSLVLVAHHVDVTFGDLSVVPLGVEGASG